MVVVVAKKLVGFCELDLVVEQRKLEANLIRAELAIATKDEIVKN